MGTSDKPDAANEEHPVLTRFDLSSPEFVANPYATYSRLHQEAPVHWCEQRQYYYVSHLPYVRELFRDPRASSDRVKLMVSRLSEAQQKAVEPLVASLSKWLLFQDPPTHTSLRKVINQALSSTIVSEMSASLQVIVNELIDDFYGRGRCELIRDFAYPLPAIVISQLLGVPARDRDRIKQWSDEIARFLGDKTSPERVAKTQRTIMEMEEYFAFLLKRQRHNPTANLMLHLFKMQRQNPDFSDDHLIANCIGLVFAGHETTTHLIANAWLTLLNHPDQLAFLQQNPSHIDQAIEECIRYESPIQRLGRFVTEPITLGSYRLQAGKRVLLLIGAANRDPILTENPNTFDVQRVPCRHMSFGHGIHLCSGAALGRLETKIAITALVRRLKNPRLVDAQPQWLYNLGLRGMRRFPIEF